ncbi:GtrA family protein [Enterococcus lactis]|uniref:GtrA family protein n=1 Tax=Enterococcus lactis TaxID=357441 RepID=UPI0022E170E7|nr:GtrA family protein [Enterococcus lactis]
MNKIKEINNYIFWGIITTIINIVLFKLFNKFLGYQLSNFFSWIITVFIAYVSNAIFVFSNFRKLNIRSLISFYFSRVVTYLLEVCILFIGVTLLQFKPIYVKIIANILVVIINYILSKIYIFKEK